MVFRRNLAIAMALASLPVLARAEDQAVTSPAAPAPAAAPIDPARLAAAKLAVDALFPAGTYAKLMNSSMGPMITQMTDQIYALPIADLARSSGRSPEELSKLGKTSIAQVMQILDPAFKERQHRTTHIIMAGVVDAMTEIEPSIREGMAEAYARRLDLTQLEDLNRFFATPSGKVYAANQMSIGADPAVLARMQQFMPLFIQRMPALMQQATKATADLPPARKVDQLSPTEKAELDKLLGQPPASPPPASAPAK